MTERNAVDAQGIEGIGFCPLWQVRRHVLGALRLAQNEPSWFEGEDRHVESLPLLLDLTARAGELTLSAISRSNGRLNQSIRRPRRATSFRLSLHRDWHTKRDGPLAFFDVTTHVEPSMKSVDWPRS